MDSYEFFFFSLKPGFISQDEKLGCEHHQLMLDPKNSCLGRCLRIWTATSGLLMWNGRTPLLGGDWAWLEDLGTSGPPMSPGSPEHCP